MKFLAWFRYWLRTVYAASTNKDFYRRIEGRKVSESIGHLALLAAFLWVLPFLAYFFVGTRQAAGGLLSALRSRVPAGTVFEMKDGAFSNTLPGPLVFGDEKDGLLIVNSATSALGLEPDRVGAVVSASGVMQQSDSKQQTLSFAKAPNFRVSREQIIENIGRWMPLALFFLAVLAGLAIFAVYFIGFLLSALIHAVVLWIALKIVKRAWPFRQAYAASAYASTGPIMIGALLSVAVNDLGWVPGLWYWLIIFWIVYDLMARSKTAPGKGETDGRQESPPAGRAGADDRPGQVGGSGPGQA